MWILHEGRLINLNQYDCIKVEANTVVLEHYNLRRVLKYETAKEAKKVFSVIKKNLIRRVI